MHLSQILNLPVRVFDTPQKKWIYIISTPIFSAFFILFYEPFGIGEELDKTSITFLRVAAFIGGETLAIFMSLYFFQFVVLKPYLNKTIRLKRYLIFFFLEMLCLSVLLNAIDTATIFLWFPHELALEFDPVIHPGQSFGVQIREFSIDTLFILLVEVFILSYPFMGCLLYFNVIALKNEVNELEGELNQFKTSYQHNKELGLTLELLDENNHIEFTVNLDRLLAIESSNQYVLIYYLNANHTLSKQIIRTRLKKILGELEHQPILQCHRSYAVNLLRVKQLKHSDKKRYLIFSESDQLKIPVSKTYFNQIKERLIKPIPVPTY